MPAVAVRQCCCHFRCGLFTLVALGFCAAVGYLVWHPHPNPGLQFFQVRIARGMDIASILQLLHDNGLDLLALDLSDCACSDHTLQLLTDCFPALTDLNIWSNGSQGLFCS